MNWILTPLLRVGMWSLFADAEIVYASNENYVFGVPNECKIRLHRNTFILTQEEFDIYMMGGDFKKVKDRYDYSVL